MKTSYKNRLMLALAALLLVPVFVLPVWTIKLTAPQYPEGMGLYIGVSEVRGHDTHDLQNINILNHYIGMKPIEPDGIPELDLFPPILASIIAAGLIAAVVGRRWLMTMWLVGFAALAAAGLVDFYLWMIDYGHNLDPRAPIRIPDMTYTPPLIGTKQLLNISASSWPHAGSLFLGLSMALGAWSVIRSYRRPAGRDEGESNHSDDVSRRRPVTRRPALVAVFAASIALAGCGGASPGPAETPDASDRIVYGESEDPYCGERVERVRWGGEIRTVDGERLRFRSTECLAAYLLESRTPHEKIAAVKVVDFPHGWRLIDAHKATFLHTPNLASPTRLNLMAIGTEKMAVNLQNAYTGPLVGWEDVLEIVAREWRIGSDPISLTTTP